MNTTDRHLEEWRAPGTEHARAIVDAVILAADTIERQNSIRQRARTVSSSAIRRASIEAVELDILHSALTASQRILVSQSKQVLGRGIAWRGRHAVWSKQLPAILKQMAAVHAIEIDRGFFECPFRDETLAELDTEVRGHDENAVTPFSQRTRIRPGALTFELLRQFPVNYKSLKYSPLEELVLIKGMKRFYKDVALSVPYEDSDNPFSEGYRRDLTTINEANSRVDFTFDHLALQPDHQHMRIDSSSVRYRRIFSLQNWKLNGRYYGGFHQPLHKLERINGIQMDGQLVGEVDYGQTFPRLAHAYAGVPFASGEDFYTVKGIDPHYREIIKKLCLIVLSSKSRPVDWPASILKVHNGESFIEQYEDVGAVLDLIEGKYPPEVRSLLYNEKNPLCLRLMFMESQLLTQVHLLLIKQGIVGLGTFDAIIVPLASIQRAKDSMLHLWARAFPKVKGSITTIVPE